ncbi:glycosyltransferase [Herbiconiux moechotypicola]|uniref:Polysaccharide pyruvyl transferase domain-containing protein n=1 Tax=Herbiconiux moechotypicola TaxID=637393 RepID=A0ABN3DR70_9MICO|nr:glycosyltransferase [Herbiconiux moechotypicola]MCS5731503.1 glycosyltransferase [Herbiconiux moechotypicola]
MTRVYVSGIGQHDNVGDTVLRRSLIDALRGSGELHVLVGSLADDYVEGLQLHDSDVVYRSESSWHKSVLKSGLRRRTWMVFSAGEAIADLHSAPDRLRHFIEGVVLRLRGGGSIQTGVGIRRPVGRWKLPLLASLWPARLVTWRDAASRRIAGFGSVTPDWAYAVGSPEEDFATTADRRHIAITLRNDRPYPNETWLSTVREYAARNDLAPLVVTQVKSDSDSCRRLADDLDAELLEWTTDNLWVQEGLVREALGRSRVMISDRVHGLIIGLTEGAMPIAYSPRTPEKAIRTLSAIGLDEISHTENDLSVPEGVTWLKDTADRADEAFTRLNAARLRLAKLTDELHSLITHGRSERQVTMTTPARPYITVLHSMAGPKPGEPTRYANHMLDGAPSQVTTKFFSWKYALTGDYDVFHVHWPEYLLRGSTARVKFAKRLAFIMLMVRLRLKRVPIVRTAHNLDAHEAGGGVEQRMVAWTLRRTTTIIKLNETTPVDAHQHSVTILHGHYRDRFRDLPTSSPVSGRILYFGLIRPYKGVVNLVQVFRSVSDPSVTLRVVGKPSDSALADAVSDEAALDPRVTTVLDFVPDADLVRELSEAQLVVFPYEEMHNSGALLVALSMDRAVLVPRSVANEAIAREVGAEWVTMYDGKLTAETLLRALATAQELDAHSRPALQGRDWDTVGKAHYETYLDALRRAHNRRAGVGL